MWLVFVALSYLIVKTAIKMWKRIDYEDKTEEIEDDLKQASTLPHVNEKKLNKAREELDKFKKL